MARPQTYRMNITSDMANLARVADFVARIATENRLTQKQSDDVQMAIDEAVTNIMEHAYAERTDGRIEITCKISSSEFDVVIRDCGAAFDSDSIAMPDIKSPLSQRSIGGLGIFFMRQLMDTVEFTRDADGNVTRMTKHLK